MSKAINIRVSKTVTIKKKKFPSFDFNLSSEIKFFLLKNYPTRHIKLGTQLANKQQTRTFGYLCSLRNPEHSEVIRCFSQRTSIQIRCSLYVVS